MQFHFATVVWGPWHTAVYLEANLPSLLASGNLPAFAARHQVEYRIYTTEEDIPRIEASPAFQRARQIVPFEFVRCNPSAYADPIQAHHEYWKASIDGARRAGAMSLFVPPDVIWANGGIGHVGELFDKGSRAVFMTYVRVISETCVPEVKRLFGVPGTAIIDAPARRLVELTMRHIHPLALTYDRDSTHFPIHPELILWPIPDEGMLMRVLVREMFAYDPRLIRLNPQGLPDECPDAAGIHYITDSDALFSMSLTPYAKDIEWYVTAGRLSPPKIGSWWLVYDSPANDLVAAQRFYVHSCARTPEKWRRAEIESDRLMRRLIGVREVLRCLADLQDQNFSLLRQIAMMGLSETKLASIVARWKTVSFLLPGNDALQQWLENEGDSLFLPRHRRRFLKLLLDHVILEELVLEEGREKALTTASGGARRLTWQDGTPLVDGIPVEPRVMSVGTHRAYAIERIACS